jgi:hypothetical protein
MATTQKKPDRAPRKPSRASGSAQGGTTARKPATGRRTARTTGPTKPNPFDDIARQVNADQEAKDREAGRDVLTPALAKSVDQAKAKRAAIKPAKPARPAKPAAPAKSAKPSTPARPAKPTRPAKVQVTGNGKTFAGRPVTDPAKVAARVKETGLRLRADADVDAIAARLRATPDAVSAWLEARNGKQSAKVTTTKQTTAKANDKPKSEWVTGITLQHAWTERIPDYLKSRTLVIRYQVKADGTVWSTLTQLREADGSLVPHFKDYPLDYRPTQERDGRNRPVILKGDLEGPALKEWLLKQGIASPRDIETST